MPRNNSGRKERVTLSLSKRAVQFLRTFRKQENSPSLSALVESMIEKARHARDLADLDASVTAYYNSLSEAEVQEQAAWGEIGAAGLAALESEAHARTPEAARVDR